MSIRVSHQGRRKYYAKSAASGSDDADFVNNIDTLDYRSVAIVVNLEAFAYSGTNKLKFELQHSDTTTAGDYADVDQDDIDGDTLADGELFEQATAIAANSTVTREFHYKGSKRYLRVGLDETGSTTGSYQVFVVLDEPREQPVN